jgi:hypothetical protein
VKIQEGILKDKIMFCSSRTGVEFVLTKIYSDLILIELRDKTCNAIMFCKPPNCVDSLNQTERENWVRSNKEQWKINIKIKRQEKNKTEKIQVKQQSKMNRRGKIKLESFTVPCCCALNSLAPFGSNCLHSLGACKTL